jgi:formylglycine-generating enzyme required for sulfatase activity
MRRNATLTAAERSAQMTEADRQAAAQLRAWCRPLPESLLDLACCAAFPMLLTTDLVNCLRENFVPHAPWYGVADILLAGWCEAVGDDLYELSGPMRRVLIGRLARQPDRVRALEAFMSAYIQYRLGTEPTDRARLLGDRPDWTALACLGDTDRVLDEIRAALRAIATSQRDRLHLIAMAESYGDSLLAGTPILQWVEQPEAELEPEANAMTEWATQLGVTLRPIAFVTATVRRGVASDPDPQARQTFEFATVTVDRQGQVSPPTVQTTWGFTESLAPGLGLDLVAIPGGSFVMGSPPDESERYDDEGPQHRVTVVPYFIGRFAVTQAQWREVAGWPRVDRDLDLDPSEFKGDNRPVETISWPEASEFCARLTQATGRLYGLPSEAEWEYACRAGTTTPFNVGPMLVPAVANYDWSRGYDGVKVAQQKDFSGTTPVGQFPANAWGLYDMHGNVWEWCQDHWHDTYRGAPSDGRAWIQKKAETDADRVIRGGSWFDKPQGCRSAIRVHDFARYIDDNDGGFRVVCRLPRTL